MKGGWWHCCTYNLTIFAIGLNNNVKDDRLWRTSNTLPMFLLSLLVTVLIWSNQLNFDWIITNNKLSFRTCLLLNTTAKFSTSKDNWFSLNHWDISDNSVFIILYKVFRFCCLKLDCVVSKYCLAYHNAEVSLVAKSGRRYRVSLKDQ